MILEGFSCTNCNASVRSSARFCRKCGAQFSDSDDPGEVAPEPNEPLDGDQGFQPSSEDTPKRGNAQELARELKPIAWLFGILLFSSLVGGLASHFVEHFALIEASVVGFDAVVVFVFCVAYWRDLDRLVTLKRPSIKALAETGLVFLGFILVMEGAFAILATLTTPLLQVTDYYLTLGFPVWLIYAWIGFIPAFVEELAFRGVIQSRLERVLGVPEAWILQAALFSVLHLNPLIFVTHFAMGLAFGWLRNRTQSIYPGMLLHGVWNSLVVFQELNPNFLGG